MRWYGIEIKKFCGSIVGTSEPVTIPVFDFIVKKATHTFNVLAVERDIETINVGFKLNSRKFTVSVDAKDIEIVNMCLVKNKKQFIANFE